MFFWSDSLELSVADFTGPIPQEDERSTEISHKLWAKSACKLRISISEGDSAILLLVKPYFDRKTSWIDTTDLDSNNIEELLNHETGHFNISEYIARLIRQRVDSLEQNGLNDIQLFNKIVQESFEDLESLNNEYDKDTLHGMILSEQKKWDKKIEIMLLSLKQYSSTIYMR